MARSNIIIIAVLILFLSGCFSNKENNYLLEANKTLKYGKENFEVDYSKEGLVSHFPDKITYKPIVISVDPPACPPSYECSAQFGNMYLICKADSTIDYIPTNVIFETEYLCDSNIIIDLLELRRSIFPVDKCNKWYENRIPIPYFESYNFELGTKEIKKEVGGETHYKYIYSIPSDLKVYVIQAESGNFWKESCNEKRPEKLKEWKNGYSKGVAISQKENIVVYWSMLW